uniref:Putative secreted protein n=1 Tax=Anopheles triannulatus TaxID=58253 RepID=A0A2M4B779_9DIPT
MRVWLLWSCLNRLCACVLDGDFPHRRRVHTSSSWGYAIPKTGFTRADEAGDRSNERKPAATWRRLARRCC